MTRLVFALLSVAWFLTALSGCSTKPEPKRENPNVSNLRRIRQAFDLCQDRAKRPVRDEEDLLKWLSNLGDPGDPATFLVSPRDGEPFVIFYGNRLDPENSTTILTHEKNGAEGTRFVLLISGSVKSMTDAEFAVAPKAEKKAAKPRN
jgi:hypothetical protein